MSSALQGPLSAPWRGAGMANLATSPIRRRHSGYVAENHGATMPAAHGAQMSYLFLLQDALHGWPKIVGRPGRGALSVGCEPVPVRAGALRTCTGCLVQ